jgi:hypothetical protein
LTHADGGLGWLLSNVKLGGEVEPRLADAVAVAGLQAATEHRRRAVLLVLGRDAADASRYDPATVRRYLAALSVPLFVWSLEGPDTPAAKAWGGAEDVSNVRRLYAAVDRLTEELESQRIVWVEGRHLPQTIALTPAAKGIELIGTPRASFALRKAAGRRFRSNRPRDGSGGPTSAGRGARRPGRLRRTPPRSPT